MSYILPPDPTSITTQVATNADDIAANQTTITDHASRLTTAEGDIVTNATNIATNVADISTNVTDISTINGQKNAANGLCPLDGSTEVPLANLKTAVANGLCTLDGSSEVAIVNLKTGVANGICPLDASTEVALTYLKNDVANGICGLDGSAEVPMARLKTGGASELVAFDSNNDIEIVSSNAQQHFLLRKSGGAGASTSAEITLDNANDALQLEIPGGPGTVKFWFKPNGDFYPAGTALSSADIGVNSATATWTDAYFINTPTATSDVREKKNIKKESLGLNFLRKLQPKSYVWKNKGNRRHHGLIAQDVEKLCKDAMLVKTPTKDGKDFHYALRYSEFIGPIIQAVKEMDEEQQRINARLDVLEKK